MNRDYRGRISSTCVTDNFTLGVSDIHAAIELKQEIKGWRREKKVRF